MTLVFFLVRVTTTLVTLLVFEVLLDEAVEVLDAEPLLAVLVVVFVVVFVVAAAVVVVVAAFAHLSSYESLSMLHAMGA